MGWTFSPEWTSAKECADGIVSESAASGYTVSNRATTSYGRHLWLVLSHPKVSAGRPFIALYLLESSDGSWGYKGMDESMGPYTYDCPLAFLDLAPETSADWRKNVRAYHARKGATFAPGDDVTIHGKRYVVVEPYKRSWLVSRDGQRYKASPKDMRLTVEVEREAREERERIMASPFQTITAFGDWHPNVPKGMVGIIATRGANRVRIGEERNVLVPTDVYSARQGTYTLTGNEAPWSGPNTQPQGVPS